MKTKLLLIIGAFVIFFNTSCKKEKTATPETPTPQAKTIEGELIRTFQLNGTGTNNWYCSAKASFWESTNTSVLIDPDSVSMDGFWLSNQTSGDYYKFKEWIMGTKPFNCSDNVDWNITGSTKVPSFTYTTTNNIPNIDNSYISLSSVSLSSGFTISHPTINATNIEYSISNGSGSGFKKKTILSSSSGVTFSSSELTGFTTSNSGQLKITATFSKTISPQTGVNFKFSNVSSVIKTVSITN